MPLLHCMRESGASMKCCSWISSGYLVLAISAIIGLLFVAPTQAQTPDRPADGVTLERDVDNGLVLIKIPAADGKVAWEDVLRALLRVGHMDDDAIKDKFPSGTLDLTRAYSRYSLMAINVAMAPDIRMRIVDATDKEPAHLLVTIDEDKINERKRKMSKRIRNRVTGGEVRSGLFGLRLKDGPWKSDPVLPLAIVVHGFNSSPERFEPLAAALREEGFASATYSYPDDQPIDDSAEQLSDDLKTHAAKYPQRPIYLVTHSMGGLVARNVIEQADLDPGTVSKLIMIAPPNHGSLLANFAFGVDIVDQLTENSKSEEVTRFYAAVEDGLSEAKDDLKPDSPFLRKLNARERNPQVSYSIFLGTGGHLEQSQVDRLRTALRTGAQRSTAVGLFAPHLDQTLADLDEVVAGKGDGVVAVKRGRLAGVDDIVLADFTHLGVLQIPASFDDDPIFQGVVQRLKR